MPDNKINNYLRVEEIHSNITNIKTYKAIKEYFLKELYFNNEDEYNKIKACIEFIKNEDKIKIDAYQEEENRIIAIIESNEEDNLRFDSIIVLNYDMINKKIGECKISEEKNKNRKLPSNENKITNEGITKDNIGPISKQELKKLFKKEFAMCQIEAGKNIGTGFFCEINLDKFQSPLKYCLFTNNHIIDQSIFNNENIYITYTTRNNLNLFKKVDTKKELLEKKDKRIFITNKSYDYTCIEMFKNEIKNTFKPYIFLKEKDLKNQDIFILQYPLGGNISFSGGKIINGNTNLLKYNASTEDGSSGSPIIRRIGTTSLNDSEYQVIGLHCGRKEKKDKGYSEYNGGIGFDLIISDIIFKMNALENIKINNGFKNLNCFFTGDENGIKEIYKIFIRGKEYKREEKLILNMDKITYKEYKIDGNSIRVNFTTEGRFKKHIPKNLIKYCICLFFVYDISNIESFENIEEIITNAEKNIENFKAKYLLTLIGIKLKKERNINYEEGQRFCTKNKIKFFEINPESKNVAEELDDNFKKVFSVILQDLKFDKEKIKKRTSDANEI